MDFVKNLSKKHLLLIALLGGLIFNVVIGIIDVANWDNTIHLFISHLLGQKNVSYFDIDFIPTSLSVFEIIALFLAVGASFIILGEQEETNKKNTILANQPFVVPSRSIIFQPRMRPPKLLIGNIGSGPALFIRISFSPNEPDAPYNAILRFDQPHSFYLEKNDSEEDIEFDETHFYEFIARSKNASKLNRIELTEQINNLVGEEFLIYIHVNDILKRKIIFK